MVVVVVVVVVGWLLNVPATGERRHGLKNNAKVSKKTCRKTTARKPTSL